MLKIIQNCLIYLDKQMIFNFIDFLQIKIGLKE